MMKVLLFLLCLFSTLYSNQERPPHALAKVRRLPAGNTLAVLHFVKHFLPENPVILEAGANNGEDSARFATFWPQGTLYAFEPVPELLEAAKARCAPYGNVHFCEKALSDREG